MPWLLFSSRPGDDVDGTIASFHGVEQISQDSVVLYELHYRGGLAAIEVARVSHISALGVEPDPVAAGSGSWRAAVLLRDTEDHAAIAQCLACLIETLVLGMLWIVWNTTQYLSASSAS